MTLTMTDRGLREALEAAYRPKSPWLACVDCGAPAWARCLYTAIAWRGEHRCDPCATRKYHESHFAGMPIRWKITGLLP